MAPVRQTRPAEEDVEVLESASSNFRRKSNKRQRLSTHEDSASDNDADNGRGAYTATQIARRGGNREEYERLRDTYSEDEDDEEAIERATQDIRKQQALTAGLSNQAADAGVVEMITCINFMCHTKLVIQLGSLINFVVGHNGSGKSAVLTALTLCLGGKATSTNRGQSLKSFVKEGQESATLIVKLKNQGDGAYRPDLYGESIIIERHFTIHGSSGFKVKASNGRVISTKRAELDEISDFFTLQLENPVNVLTQDLARQFLNNSSEAEKYRFFIKGIQLEQLDNDYILLTESLDATDAYSDSIREDMKILENKYKQAKQKFEISAQQDNLRVKFGNYSRQMAWAQVEEQEQALEQLKRNVEQAENSVLQYREEAQRYETAYEEANGRHEEGKAALEERKGEIEQLSAKKEAAAEEFDGPRQDLMELVSQQRMIQGSLKAAEGKVSKLRTEIDAEKQRLEAVDGGSTAAKLAEIEEAERAKTEALSRQEELPTILQQYQRQETSASLKLKDAKAAAGLKQDELREASRRLKELQDDHPRPYAAWSNHSIAQIIKTIDQETRWRGPKAIGPVGEYITLLKPEWSYVLEGYFGASLNNFIVTCKEDQMLMQSILGRFNCRGVYGISIGTSSRINTTPNEPDENWNTVLRTLRIENDLVRNQVLLNQNAEKTLLIRDMREANRVMVDNAPPRNASQCIYIHPKFPRKGSLLRGGQDKQSMSAIKEFQGRPRMRTDLQSQISLQHEHVEALRLECSKLEDFVKQCSAELEHCRKAIAQHKRQEREIKVAFDRASDDVQRLKDELDAATPGDGKLDALKEQLVESQEDLVHQQSQFEASISARDELNVIQRERKTVLDAASDALQDAERKRDKVEQKIAKLSDVRLRALREKNAAVGQVTDAQKEMERIEGDCARQQTNVEDFVRQATQLCERVPVDRGETAKTLDKRLHTMQEQLTRYDREMGGDREQLAQDATQTKEAWDTAKQHAVEIENMQELLKSSLIERHKRWKRFLAKISERAKAGFRHLLKERDFDGKLILDHEQKLLQLRVQPDGARRGQDGRKTQTLSGGEKSFSTICLLLALWDAMGSPIRCLDEFDVFMDSVNRDVSMGMMIDAARCSVSKQFILITPQAMGSVVLGPDVKVIKLSDPERGQTTLNFGQP